MKLALNLLVAAALVACLPTTEPIPSESEAETFLAMVVELASQERFDDLCGHGGGSCERILDDAGPVPSDPPTLVGARELQATANAGALSTGGQILELCGETSGEPYYTEMLVFRQDGDLLAIEPVYWSGFRIETDGTVGGPAVDASLRCRAQD